MRLARFPGIAIASAAALWSPASRADDAPTTPSPQAVAAPRPAADPSPTTPRPQAVATPRPSVDAFPAARTADSRDDRTVAQALIAELERDTAHSALIADPLARARAALERSVRLRAAADEIHARAADGLSREWAETARDLILAVDEEARAADARREAREGAAQVERARALVEEGVARLGRLRAAIADAQREREGARTAVEVHEGDAKPAVSRPRAPAAKAHEGAP